LKLSNLTQPNRLHYPDPHCVGRWTSVCKSHS